MKQKNPSQPKRKRLTQKVDLATFPEVNPNPISEIDLEGRIYYLNPAARRLFPTLETKGLGHPWLADWKSVADFFRSRRDRSVLRQVTLKGHCYQQTMYYVADTRRVRVYGMDITEREKAEQALRAAKDAAENEKQRLQAVMEALPVGVAITDAQGGSIQSNSMFDLVWGGAHPPARAVSDYVGYKARWPDTGKPVLPEEWGSAQAVHQGKSVVGQLMEIERFDGARGYVINSAAPIRDAAGTIVGAAVAIQDITELRHTQDALHESEEKYRRLIENVDDLVCEVDAEARYRFVNSRYEQILGYAPEELLGKRVRELIHPDDLKLSTPSFKKLVDGRTISRNEWRFKHKNGEWRWFDCVAQTYEKSPGDTRVVVISRDLTDRKRREVELRQLNRTLRALSNINQAMMRIQGEAEFLQQVCKIVVDDCGHAMVWIGYAEEDKDKTVRPVAYAGFEEGYLDTLKITWADSERGRGPTGSAIRTGKPIACRNMLTDPKFKPWREEALKRGYASSIVFPLKDGDRSFGAMTIYARQPDAFSEDEVNLLSELAGDLSFGITANRLRIAHAQAERALSQSEERYRSLFNSMTEGCALHEIICDEEGVPCDYRFLDINQAFERLTGLKREQVIDRTMREVLPDEDPLWIEAYGKVALTGEPVHFENYSPALNRHYEVFAYSPAPRQFAVVFMEITERKQMEEALRASRDDLERIVAERTAELRIANTRLRALTRDIVATQEEERRRVSRELHDEAGQALTALKLSLQSMQRELPPGWTAYCQHLGEAVALTDTTLEQIRMLAQDLRPPALDTVGLDVTLEGLCKEFAHRTLIEVRYAGVQLPGFTGTGTICLYRFLQEALTNAARHGHATEIRVCLAREPEGVCLSVEDNGQGFDTRQVLSNQLNLKSMGLIGMQERTKMVGGRLEIYSNPGRGTRLIARVPLEAA